MILREFIRVNLPDGEKLRVIEDTTSVAVQRFKISDLDQAEEWTTLWAGSRGKPALNYALGQFVNYQKLLQLSLAEKAF